VLSTIATAADPVFVSVVSINFNGDTPGQPPAIGGADQPTSLITSPGTSINVESSANGIVTQPVVITASAPSQFASVFRDFSPVTSGIVRVEATVAFNRLLDGGFLQTSVTGSAAVVTRLIATSTGLIESDASPRSVIGTYAPNQPFRVRMDIDMTAKTWSASVDSQLNGFADDPVVSGLPFENPVSVLPQVGSVSAFLSVFPTGPLGGSVSFDDITVATDQLAPDAAFEQSAFGSYFTDGPCAFAWATDQARSPTHSRKIVATSTGLCRWLSQTTAIQATPGATYDASVFVKTNLVQDGAAYLSVNFWTADGTYIPYTTDSPQQVSGTQDWTPLFVEAKAPPGAAYVRLEFRLSGRGTAWFDDTSLSTGQTQPAPTPPDTTILNSNVIAVPTGPYTFAFTSDQPDAGFQCSFDGSAFATCSSPVTISLTPGQHTFQARAVSPGGLVDPTPASQTLIVSSNTTSNLAPDPDFQQDPSGSYFTNGDATFSWSNGNGHNSAGLLQIDATSNTLNRWLSRTAAIPATPGAHYHVTVWAKTQAIDGHTGLSVNFWDANGTYIPATIDSSTQLSGTTDWTQLSLDATAPPGTAYIRVEFRQTGPGTSQFDDVAITKT
jgi:hypothetical protein